MSIDARYFSTKPGAEELAQRIGKYWAQRGFDFRYHLELVRCRTFDGKWMAAWCIRSNLTGHEQDDPAFHAMKPEIALRKSKNYQPISSNLGV